MIRFSLSTARCIVTGAPAKVFTGHLVAKSYGRIARDGTMPIETIAISSGFASSEVAMSCKADDRGCHGEWKPEYGLTWSTDGMLTNHDVERQDRG